MQATNNMQDYTTTGNPTTDAINKARAQNISTGVSPYSGSGATNFSVSQGLGGAIPTTINSNSLTPTTPITLPSITSPTTAAGVIGSAASLQAQLKDSLAQDTASKQNAADSQKTVVQGFLDKITGVQTDYANAEGDASTPGTPAYLKEQARNASLALDTSEKSRLAELDALQGQGLGQTQLQQKQAEITNRYGRIEADQQFAYHIANSDYTAAEDILTKKYQLQLEPLKTQLEYQTGVYNDLKGSLSRSEDRQFNNLIDSTNKQIETTQQNQKDVTSIYSTLLQNNPDAFKQDPSLAVNLTNQPDAQSAMRLLASKGVSLANQVDEAYKRAQTAALNVRTLGTTPTTFTQSQLNTGASHAGVDISAFKGLDTDVKNYFVHLTTTSAKAVNDAISHVADGSENADDVKAEIDQSLAPDSAKEYLKQRVDAVTPKGTNNSGGGFWSKVVNFWNGK